MEKINEKYYLDSDSHNFVLLKKKKSTNGESYDTVGYYGNINMLYNGLINKEIKDDLGIIKNIEKILKLLDDAKKIKN